MAAVIGWTLAVILWTGMAVWGLRKIARGVRFVQRARYASRLDPDERRLQLAILEEAGCILGRGGAVNDDERAILVYAETIQGWAQGR
jgi:hypothetical protein